MSTDLIYQADAQVGELKLWRPPEQVLIEAQQAAAALQRIISTKLKKVVFNGEQYLEYEDWQTLSHFFGYVPKVETTEFVNFGDVQGFKASAILLNEHTGMIVSRAESMCLNDEENWGPRPKYEWKDILDPEGKKIWDKANSDVPASFDGADSRLCEGLPKQTGMGGSAGWVQAHSGRGDGGEHCGQ
jgi:hypothetical protein